MELMHASRQWATRPADERFTSLVDLHEHTSIARARASSMVMSTRRLAAMPTDDNRGLQVVADDKAVADVTHWAFGQLSQRAGAPAGYLRGLPSPLAADCINYGLKFNRGAEDIGVLVSRDGDLQVDRTLRAVTGPSYGRVWNSTITQSLLNRFGDGVTGDFRVPGEFGKAVAVTKQNTTLYASDRDMFVFLADEEHKITVPNRRNGLPGEMSRGFFVWNSEVGSQSFGAAFFLFDYTCSNRIVWGAQDFREIRIRHTASAPDRWIEEIVPAIETYAASSTAGVQQVIAAAQAKKVDDLDAFLKGRFGLTGSQATAIKAAHLEDEQRPMESLWDVSTGITAYARGVQFQDERVALERVGGKVLALAA